MSENHRKSPTDGSLPGPLAGDRSRLPEQAPLPRVGADGLTKRERAFCLAYKKSGSIEQAAKAAGLSRSASFRLKKSPKIRAFLADLRAADLEDNADVAVRVLREVMTDRHAPAAARVSAAKVALEALPDSGPGGPAAPPVGTPLDAFSVAQLEAFITGGLAALATARRTIDVTPD